MDYRSVTCPSKLTLDCSRHPACPYKSVVGLALLSRSVILGQTWIQSVLLCFSHSEPKNRSDSFYRELALWRWPSMEMLGNIKREQREQCRFFPPRRRTRQGPQCEAERTIRPLLCFYIARHWAHRGQDSNTEITVRGGAVTVIIAQHHVALRHNVMYTSCWVTNQWTDEGQPANELGRGIRIEAWHRVHLLHTADTAAQKASQKCS